MAKQRMTEHQRAAREASEARRQRRIARGRAAKAEAPDQTVVPAIPDFVHEMFETAPDIVRGAAPDGTARGDTGRDGMRRGETGRGETGHDGIARGAVPAQGRHARTGR
ncbi:MAG TPA: hypothetical protein VHF26_04835 [Trebonia sp.]|nr:hypothetical protein [Trebonia sp.]